MFSRSDQQPTFYFEMSDGMPSSRQDKPRYMPDSHFDANHSEFCVSAFARGQLCHGSNVQEWIDAWVRIFPQSGRLLTCGLWIRDAEKSNNEEAHIVLGESVGITQDNSEDWKITYTFRRHINNIEHIERPPAEFAFFIDVERPSGEIIRLWQSAVGSNFRLQEIFSQPGIKKAIPYGSLEFATEDCSLFDQKKACARPLTKSYGFPA